MCIDQLFRERIYEHEKPTTYFPKHVTKYAFKMLYPI